MFVQVGKMSVEAVLLGVCRGCVSVLSDVLD